jgi:hypothetical protein
MMRFIWHAPDRTASVEITEAEADKLRAVEAAFPGAEVETLRVLHRSPRRLERPPVAESRREFWAKQGGKR